MKWIILFLAGSLSAQTYDDYGAHLIVEEGMSYHVYQDSRGHPTIGIGHKIKEGERFLSPISDEQVQTLFIQDLSAAIDGAKRHVPSFEVQPPAVKILLASMVFNLGPNGFAKFKKFRQRIEEMDYKGAAGELRNSLYYKQLPNRVGRYIEVLEKA